MEDSHSHSHSHSGHGDQFGYVHRDSDVLQRAIQSEGVRTGKQRGGAAGPEAAGATSGQRARQVAVGLPQQSMSGPQEHQEQHQEELLPQSFQAKYLGARDARGLWGIKHTRRPVDALVAAAKNMPPGVVLPLVKLHVSKDGVSISSAGAARTHPIDTISYGVQDLVYTRVFSMIVVREQQQQQQHQHQQHPFECHAFVCDSRSAARRLTYALAAAFNEYSKVVKAGTARKKFAIDLRTPEEIAAELSNSEQHVDSEA